MVVLCVIAFGVGIALLGKAHTMPAHIDEPKAQYLAKRYEWRQSDMSPQERERRASEIANLRTAKWFLYNMGVCLCLAAATFAVAIVRFRLWDMRNLKAATTPRTRWRLIALGSGAWLALIPAFLLQLHDDYAQDDLMPLGDHAPGGDSVLFLMTGTPLIVAIWIFSTLICRFFILGNVDLPATLWGVDYGKTSRSVVLNVFYGALIILLVAFVMWSALYYIWAIPSGLVGIYVMLSSRAGLLSRKAQNS